MTPTEIRKILEENQGDLAFLVGNGINRHKSEETNYLSWDALLKVLWEEVQIKGDGKCPDGISVTEFYDLLSLEADFRHQRVNLQQHVCSKMTPWEPQPHHTRFVKVAQELNAPILTTNYEKTLHTPDMGLQKIKKASFTDYYPWSTYYAAEALSKPNDGFGVWHVNGMINYHRSIRLGLTHYMGSVERARKSFNHGKRRIFKGYLNGWAGEETWLDILFRRSLFIFGLGLYENEVFLRWLLIERARLFRKNPDLYKKGWYIAKKGESTPLLEGRKFFLESLGIQYVEVDDYPDIYEGIWK